ncbi:cupin domain-containing protein [Acuticoccus sp. I52.16.1]|uniref:cupin domain-containing protein n=1 Tax=Acuticoccus sp. I52.16.1 TaxID=2928472 RepID=UPI001FCFE2B7|nr:cupin domain-containing protein [Acuticoccus sp. I52.16.1]UOM36110.1 cupin domain-containing protein [Acuticoccus sp. I52.16.1]
MSAAKAIIEALGMQPHPEGGYFVETFRDAPDGGRGHSTAIYYLLEAGDCSAWHRVTDAAEVWHYYAGAPLALTISSDGHDAASIRLGPNVAAGERPQAVVPAGQWQTAESLGEYSLVGCTVAPGFAFEAFEMAPADWRPTPRPSND